jgi:hypothetical protein
MDQYIHERATSTLKELCQNSSQWESIFKYIKAASHLPTKKEISSCYKEKQEDFLFSIRDRIRLCYLTTFEKDLIKSPFGKRQVEIFKKSYRWAKITHITLGVSLPILIGASCVSATSFLTLTDLSLAKQAGISFSLGTVVSCVVNGLSWCATGFNPVQYTTADDAKQDALEIERKKYGEMAKELLVLDSTHTDLAKALANQIDLEQLYKAAERDSLSSKEIHSVFRKLKESLEYIQTGKVPRSHVSKSLILSLKKSL